MQCLQMIVRIHLTRLTLVITLFLSACGGGGGSSSAGVNPGGGSGEGTPGGESPGSSTSTPQANLGAGQGQALLGPIVDATVNVYEAENFNGTIICSTTTTSLHDNTGPGVIDLASCDIDADKVYFLVVTGGMDIDVDDDGILDQSPTPKNGDLRGVVSGNSIIAGDFRLNIITELAYHYFSDSLFSGATAGDILATLDNIAQRLFQEDINGDGDINNLDLLAYHPANDREALPQATSALLDEILVSILTGDKQKVTRLSRQYLLASMGEFSYQDIFGTGQTSHSATYIVNNDLMYWLNYLADDDDDTSYYDLHVAILDVSDLSDIRIVGETYYDGLPAITPVTTPYPVRPLLHEDMLYAVSRASGLLMIDVSNPGNPDVSHALNGNAYSSLTKGPDNILFATNNNILTADLTTIDISNPDIPSVLSSTNIYSGSILYANGILFTNNGIFEVDSDGYLTQIADTPQWNEDVFAYRGNYLYATKPNYIQDAYIRTYDVSNPAAPVLIDSIEGIGIVREILVDGDKLFAQTSSGNDDGDLAVTTFQITSSGLLELLDSRSIQGDYTTIRMAKDGNRIYFSGSFSFYVYDSDAFTGRTYHLSVLPTAYSAEKIEIVGNTAFVADTQRLISVDISDPGEGLTQLDSILMPSWVEDMVIVGDYAYLAAYTEGLVIVDITDPDSLQIVGSNDELTVLGENHRTFMTSVAVSGDYAYTHTVHNQKLGIIDISDPANPTVVNTLDVDYAQDTSLAFKDSYLYSLASEVLSTYSIAEANSPQLLESKSLVANTIEVVEGYAYTTSYTSGLAVLNVDGTNASMPVFFGGTLGLGRGNAVAVNGNRAYVANEFGFVEIYDTTDKTQPTMLLAHRVMGTVNDVAVTDDYIFAVNGFGIVVERTLGSMTAANLLGQ